MAADLNTVLADPSNFARYGDNDSVSMNDAEICFQTNETEKTQPQTRLR